jgi:hypothetical protein
MQGERERATPCAPRLRSCYSGGSLPALLEGCASAACFATAPAPRSAASICKIPQVSPCLHAAVGSAYPHTPSAASASPLARCAPAYAVCARPAGLCIFHAMVARGWESAAWAGAGATNNLS